MKNASIYSSKKDGENEQAEIPINHQGLAYAAWFLIKRIENGR